MSKRLSVMLDTFSITFLFGWLIVSIIRRSPLWLILLLIVGLICAVISFLITIISDESRTRGFEIVEDKYRKNNGNIKLPCRATRHSMAYDFYSPQDYQVAPNSTVKIWTDVKSYMRTNEGLILNVRSSMGGRFMLANTQGWIDSDYYNNEKNDGNIGIFLTNITDEVMYIKKGEAIAQGMFTHFLIADNGNTDTIRQGGFGSTNN